METSEVSGSDQVKLLKLNQIHPNNWHFLGLSPPIFKGKIRTLVSFNLSKFIDPVSSNHSPINRQPNRQPLTLPLFNGSNAHLKPSCLAFLEC